MNDDANNAVEKARLFAEALDRKDYETATSLLGPGCVYIRYAGKDLHGPQAVIGSYKRGSEWPAPFAVFDSIERKSSAKPGPDGRAVITFTYNVRHKGRSLTIRAEQIIELDNAGLIGRIEQVELASQANALFKFCFELGIIRKSKPDE
jgi:hypothetical protein